jgi:two-component system, NarL family, nitrate/nitrite response regulator NarL
MTKSVAVVDDHALLAQSVVWTLQAKGLSATAFDHRDPNLVDHLCAYDLVLMDLMLGSANQAGLGFTQALVAQGIPVIVVTALTDPVMHARCIEVGAQAVISKAGTIDELVAAVRAVLDGQQLLDDAARAEAVQTIQQARALPPPPDRLLLARLSVKERSVLGQLVDGHAAARIARDMRISLLTVRAHIRAILVKLDVHSQLEAVTLAMRFGWDLRDVNAGESQRSDRQDSVQDRRTPQHDRRGPPP